MFNIDVFCLYLIKSENISIKLQITVNVNGYISRGRSFSIFIFAPFLNVGQFLKGKNSLFTRNSLLLMLAPF